MAADHCTIQAVLTSSHLATVANSLMIFVENFPLGTNIHVII